MAQRFRELEFRSLIDRLPPSSIAPTGYGPAEQDTPGGLQLSLDLLGGKAPAGGAAQAEGVRAQPSALTDPGGAIEHADPRIIRNDDDRAELDAWLEAQGDAVGIGWAAGAGRPLERTLVGIGLAGGDGTTWYLPWTDDRPLPAWFGRADRTATGHDLKQLAVMLAVRGAALETAPMDVLIASWMVNPSLRAQSLDDLEGKGQARRQGRRALRRLRGGAG